MRSFVTSLVLFSALGLATPIYDHHHGGESSKQQRPIVIEEGNILPPPPAHGHGEPGHGGHGQPDFSGSGMPDWPTTHLLARRLLAYSTTGVLSTVFPENSRDNALAGVPIGLPDYIADCSADGGVAADLVGNGNPLILALNIGTTFRNTNSGSNISLSVDWWSRRHHSTRRALTGDMDRDLDNSLAALPRLSLSGHLEEIPAASLSDADRKALEKCFLKAHPDAVYWLPAHDGSAHRGYWARLVVDKALWIGGFGDRARIGWLDIDVWKTLTKTGEDGKKGWGDVKLPGEHF
ncbi:hypothetical protein FQN57_004395 [Myotisia sp. PD_48]|nr:hypothetical protein FQN57_004395 [Myotisia sp. PD_48]